MSSLASTLPASRARQIVVSAVEAAYTHVSLSGCRDCLSTAHKTFCRHVALAGALTLDGFAKHAVRRAGTRYRVNPNLTNLCHRIPILPHTPFRERPCERGGLEWLCPMITQSHSTPVPYSHATSDLVVIDTVVVVE